MNCPHCNENIAVRLEKPGKKAARRRQLRARKAQRMAELRSAAPSDEEATVKRPHGPQMSAEAEETWERMRSLLEEVAEIAQSLSEEDMMVVEALMETWMQENPV